MDQTFSIPAVNSPLSLSLLLMNMSIGVLLSLVLRWHFRSFGSTLSNREEFGQVFPFILLTTILIITVVKSSLALSLGLVGALSIVRFRTPIKEPEELAYLFVAIAMGLGLGANQTIPTVLAGLGILGVMAVLGRQRQSKDDKNLYLSIDWLESSGDLPDDYLRKLNDIVGTHTTNSDLRRFDVRSQSLEATYYIDLENNEKLAALTDSLRSISPNVGVTFIDQKQMPQV
jgi:hypothetical protein